MCKQILKTTAIVALILINGTSLAASKKSIERNTNPSQGTFSSNGGGRIQTSECGSSHSISAAIDQCAEKKLKNIQCKKKQNDSSTWTCDGDKS